MKRTLATAGHQALADAARLHAGCVPSYPWSQVGIRPVTITVMNDFANTSKATRRLKEPSP
jgi:hypothetical protein